MMSLVFLYSTHFRIILSKKKEKEELRSPSLIIFSTALMTAHMKAHFKPPFSNCSCVVS